MNKHFLCACPPLAEADDRRGGECVKWNIVYINISKTSYLTFLYFSFHYLKVFCCFTKDE